MNEYTWKNFSMHYPHLADKVKEVFECKYFEYIMRLNDGRMISYYELENSVRNLPDEDDLHTEEAYRREFGIRLGRIMEQKHISQLELSELTGISQASISSYINQRKSPTYYTADKIAQALDCSIDDFKIKY